MSFEAMLSLNHLARHASYLHSIPSLRVLHMPVDHSFRLVNTSQYSFYQPLDLDEQANRATRTCDENPSMGAISAPNTPGLYDTISDEPYDNRMIRHSMLGVM